MLNYQQEAALYKLNPQLMKNNTEYDYFELLDLFRQLEKEGYVGFDADAQSSNQFKVHKTPKGDAYHYNWLHNEFR